MIRTLIIDNYDSFTFNLFQLLAAVNGIDPIVVHNDQLTWDQLQELEYDNVVLSPGPGTPERPSDFGVCAEIIEKESRPILGVCLGHQGICYHFGSSIVPAPAPIHGRASQVTHTARGLFEGIPSPFSAIRYHSLIAHEPLANGLRAVAWTDEHLIMAVAHDSRPIWGVQFHPESILSEYGAALLQNFRTITQAHQGKPPTPSPYRPVPPHEPKRLKPVQTQHRYRLHYHKANRYPDSEATFKELFSESPYAFWLDRTASKDGGFSYMGDTSGPDASVLSYCQATGTLTERKNDVLTVVKEDLLARVQQTIANTSVVHDEAPFPFRGGYVGYLGYELGAFEGWQASHVPDHPDAQLIFVDRFLCFDHTRQALYIVTVTPEGSVQDQDWASAALDDVEFNRPPSPPHTAPATSVCAQWQHSAETYLKKIETCLEQINAGETYEVCMTNRLHLPKLETPLVAYAQLRRTNPAPYSAFLKLEGLHVLCSSPELFLNIDHHGVVFTKPIKGTRRRGANPTEDAELVLELATHEKDRSENLMITDLLRNDLGSVCRVGSVHVPTLMAVETYPTVHQLVTTVQGQLGHDQDAIDCFRAAFPGGSMTGAPKRRTMEIIDGLEDTARGIYSGSIGYFSLDGAAELNVVIRTIVSDTKASVIGTGGAIISLSDPHSEIEEINLKSRALLEAIAISQNWQVAISSGGRS